ncbi:MAG: ferredoxin--NADP reductase [Leptospirillia bacterium]
MSKRPVVAATVADIIRETPRVSTFVLEFPPGTDFSFRSGQFAMLSLPDFLNDKGRPVRRAYSIASSPPELLDRRIAFTITRKGEGGYFSNRIHEAHVGDPALVEGPYGNSFVLDSLDPRPHLFLAAGSGIAPLRSMIRTLLSGKTPPPIELLYGFRDREDFIYADEMKEYEKAVPGFTLRVAHSRPSPGWSGHSGRVPEILPRLYPSYQGQVVYICGHPEMVTSTYSWLKTAGFPDESIRKEQW